MLSHVANNQGNLELAVRYIFPHENIITNARKQVAIKNTISGSYLEIDVWIPNLLLGFEFQDSYHYATTWYSNRSLSFIQSQDRDKVAQVHEQNITLINVPVWWDSSVNSLISSIHFQRPDLVDSIFSDPIPLNPPQYIFSGYVVPGVGEVMLASFEETSPFSLSSSLYSSTPLSSKNSSVAHWWWLGEKYDGIRAIWNPLSSTLYSRRGIEIDLPPHHFKKFQFSTFLDGEIWGGRGLFLETQKILRFDSSDSSTWNVFEFIRFIVFDDPSPKLHHLPFEKRYENFLSILPPSHSFAINATRMECRNKKNIKFLLEKIMEDKGEGIMIRRPASKYEHGRSSSLIKIKASRADSEALVIETNPDFVVVKLPGGETLQVKDVAVESKRGDIVTIEYDNITRHAVPVCPKLIRIRSDLIWAHVVGDFTRDSLLKAEINYGGEKGKITKDKRKMFENFAKSLNLDPLVPATWYSLSRQFLENQGMKVSAFRGGYSKVLQRLFPDLLFDLSLFPSVPRGYWADPANRKRFFDEFAFQNEFDPLLPHNWYSITDHKIRSVKSTGILKKYGGSFTQALMHVYPDIGLNRFNFSFLPSGYWSDKKNRKKFFDEFAQENDFDPLVADHWYSITKQSLISHKGSATVLSYYEGSLKKALLDVYPDIGLHSEKFIFFDRGHWGDAKNRKKFFDTFASDRNFDPLVAENWYTITTKDIEQTKYGRAVMYYYGWSVAKALSDLYPSISFDSQYFFKPSGFWTKENNRKVFFDRFAKSHGFDPLVASNWYSVSSHQINSTHNSGSVLRYYSGGYVKALMQIYPTIGLDEKMFSIPSGYWNAMENRKIFFDEFAKDHQFDPLVHHNWYSITPKQLRSYKNASGVLKLYSGSYVKALLDVYPDIGLQRDKFVTVESGFWGEEKNRKEFFEAFAKNNNFDALIPTNWYSVSRHKLISTKNSGSILRYYNGSFVNALEDLYPTLHLDKHSFTQLR